MKQYPFPDNRIWKAGFGAFLFLLLLLARDTLITTCLLGFNKSQFLMLGLIGAAGVVFLLVNRKNIKDILFDRRMAAIILSTVVLLVPMAAKRDWQLMYFSILLCLYVAVFLTYFVSYRETARVYVVILAVLGLYSVIATYLLRILPDSGILAVPTFVNSKDREFYNFGLAFVSIWEVKGRNFGIFREPGVYQFFLMLGLFLNNYTVQWKKTWQLWTVNILLALTMLTTFATGGVIEMGLFAVVLFFEKQWYRDRRARTIAIALVILMVIALVVILLQGGLLAYELVGMVEKLFSGTESSSTRLDAIFTDIDIFLHHPIFGEKLAAVLHAVDHNTTSTMVLYAVFGILGGTLNVAAWVALVWEKERKLWANLAYLVILFMSFNTQNLTADVFFWLFPFMALVERGLPLLNRKRTV